MEITNLEAIPVAMDVKPLAEEDGLAPYVTNHGAVETMERMLVRLDTDEGITGWGEMRTTLSAAATKTILEHDVAPEVVGREVWEIEAFADSFFYEYMDTRTFVGGVEMAMWDALGKYRDAPVHQLLGGKCTDAVDFAYCVGILSPEESRPHARRALEKGFDVLKTKAGRDWKQDVARIVAMHDEVDGELEFRLDPNQGWTFEDAVRVGAMLEDENIYLQYMEQPIRIDSFGTMKRLRNRLKTPIGANEDMYFQRNLLQMGREDAIDVGVVDIIPSGGILGMKRLAGTASDLGISLSHHCAFDLGVKTAAILHAVSTTPEINLAPDTVYYAWADDIIETPFTVEDGEIAVPDAPGLGVTVDEEKVETYRVEP
ncbi:mandelate racemase/muconate lactonizing enzyme family protein [Salinigranum salinum]|uniref:mandelate racemase/muconate lactonizing enzyme family protein n=1 Tax=Salinigranum salinum TaxID=1364937 RepID=UPI0012609248|nr:mandelate racemase/muconate lactonizing enzyme family protein [Salinigranum salinum]